MKLLLQLDPELAGIGKSSADLIQLHVCVGYTTNYTVPVKIWSLISDDETLYRKSPVYLICLYMLPRIGCTSVITVVYNPASYKALHRRLSFFLHAVHIDADA